jgi:hypothetical protein
MDRHAHRPGAARAACALAALLLAAPASAATPSEMVTTYQSLADGVLALKQTEKNLVRSILAAAYAHGEVQLARAKKALADKNAGEARSAVEALAAAVAEIATEGDSAVAGVRKKLIDGGYHHNAAGEAKGIYEPGYVIVTRDAKGKLLASSRAIAKSGSDSAALDAEWKKVGPIVRDLIGSKAK